MKLTDEQFDKMLTDALKQRFVDDPMPPYSEAEAWEQFINKRNKKKFIGKKTKLFVIAPLVAAFLLCFTLFFQTYQGDALGKIASIYYSVQDNTVSLFFSTEDNRDLPSDVDPISPHDHPKLIEAQNELPFQLLVPKYVPEGFELDDVHINRVNNEIVLDVTQYYTANQSSMIVEQQMIFESIGSGNFFNTDESNIKHIYIDHYEIAIIKNENNSLYAIWQSEDFIHSIRATGNIIEDDMEDVVRSMLE